MLSKEEKQEFLTILNNMPAEYQEVYSTLRKLEREYILYSYNKEFNKRRRVICNYFKIENTDGLEITFCFYEKQNRVILFAGNGKVGFSTYEPEEFLEALPNEIKKAFIYNMDFFQYIFSSRREFRWDK